MQGVQGVRVQLYRADDGSESVEVERRRIANQNLCVVPAVTSVTMSDVVLVSSAQLQQKTYFALTRMKTDR